MAIETKRDMFDRDLRKLYHAEVEILDLHSDLSAAATSREVVELFGGHEGDTVEQIDRIEEIFEVLDLEPREEGSSIMEGLIAEKDESVSAVTDDILQDIDVVSIGLINERLEITLLDRLLLLAEELDLPDPTIPHLEANRAEAQAALERMQQFLNQRRESEE
ncbi:DUF892 family protein [Halosimplex aquaticum]|uniref:DUF892 family protein n=1 Tax=Halosimplex aquaticum TaxID=3026162 RepID=A0ABD5Y2V0_9EURY|nr:DUF892 family protein [Halosimplex aquaticum]